LFTIASGKNKSIKKKDLHDQQDYYHRNCYTTKSNLRLNTIPIKIPMKLLKEIEKVILPSS
jgi:hypothetical protein